MPLRICPFLEMSQIFAGLNAVLGADVTAIVETGTGAPVTLKLADNGSGQYPW